MQRAPGASHEQRRVLLSLCELFLERFFRPQMHSPQGRALGQMTLAPLRALVPGK